MKDYIEQRIKEEAKYIIDNKTTIRETAKAFGVSKSTIQRDMRRLLIKVAPQQVEKVYEVIEVNKSERNLRGGIATRLKYLNN